MIPISDTLKNAVINEEKPKTLTIYPNERDIEALNWYKEAWTPNHSVIMNKVSNFGISTDTYFLAPSKINTYGFGLATVGYFSFDLKFENSVSFTKVTILLKYSDGTSEYDLSDDMTHADYNDWRRCYVRIPNPKTKKNIVSLSIMVWGSENFSMQLYLRAPQFDMLSSDTGVQEYNGTLFATDENVRAYVGKTFDTLTNDDIISESFVYDESICSADRLKFGGAESSSIEVSLLDAREDYTDCPINISLDVNDKGQFDWKNFTVKKCDKSSKGGLIVKTLKAYDKMDNLSDNAYAWYTQYMWGMSGDRNTQYANYRFDFERQIFATYFNLARAFGLDGEQYIEKTQLENYASAYNESTDFYVDYYTSGYNRLKYSKKTVTLSSSYKAYTVEYVVENEIPNYREHYDSLMRGASDIGSVCVEFFDSNSNRLFGFLYDCGDMILPPPEATTMVIYCPWVCSKAPYQTQDNAYPINSIITIYGVNFTEYEPYDIVNSYMPLVYYSYVWRKPTHEDIFKANSSITARIVMRSLMEMCGCFYKLTRDGKPQFYYPSEHGLYPANTLFPANDLFPKKSGELTMATSYYFTADFAEYQVQKFGGVQVVVNTKDNTGQVCRAEYWEDDDNDSAYLIDDNIFLCSEQFKYEYDTTDTIAMLLENLYGCLDNLQYTPFSAETIGTPFLESGDRFTLLTQNDGFESFIFERKLKGIQALKDYFEARGIQKTPRVRNFEWQ